MLPTVEPTDGPGLALHDPIESAQFELGTDRPVSPTEVDEDRLHFPVDRAVAITTGTLIVPKLVQVTVRRPDGTHLTEFEPGDSTLVEHGERLLDFWATPLVLYVRAPGPMTFTSGEEAVRVDFDDAVEVVVGCRSFHDRPAASITVPASPEAVMRALSTFGSALKTTTVERSYPTLRGHPPRLELGGELDVPDGMGSPDTGVTVELPRDLGSVMTAAPLAYYLGAEVRPGERPRIVADGVDHPLNGRGGLARSVHRTLRQVFFMDSVVRTEGLYQVPLAEREALLDRLGDRLDLAELYDASIPEQLSEYLSLPYDELADLLPEWPLCVDVAPSGKNVPALPYLVDDLALLRPVDRNADAALPALVDPEPWSVHEEAVDEFLRSDGGATRSAERLEDTFRLPEAPAMEHAYVGPDLPLGVNKCSLETLRRRLDRSPAEEPGISVRIVCNDEAMTEEGVVEEYYGLREMVQFDVTIDYGLSVRDMKAVLESDIDFLHYIGHIDDEGIRCVDGRLDAGSLDSVGVESFLLNACSSYDQGQALIEAGAVGGVVTTHRIANTTGTAMGRTISRALNCGFTLRSALAVADSYHPTTQRYLVLGDGGIQLVQGDSVAPNVVEVEPTESQDTFQVSVSTYPAAEVGPGPMSTLNVIGNRPYLCYGHLETLEVSTENLSEFLKLEVMPVFVQGELYWSDELSTNELI